jgi:RHS repeat-associated protein
MVNMVRKIISYILITAHILTCGYIKEVLAFQAQSANFVLSAGVLGQGGLGRQTLSFRLQQDSLGEVCVGKAQSASYILESGYIATLGPDVPVLDFIPDVSVNETELVKIIPHVADLVGDAISYTYTLPLNAQGEWQTGYEDSGLYTVTVTAMNVTGLSVVQQVRINVRNLNRPPVLSPISTITVNEGELVVVSPSATDPDGDAVDYYYSSPLDYTGKWLAGFDDAGTRVVNVIASDGIDTVSQPLTIIVNNVNQPPQASLTLSQYTLSPNQTVTVTLAASDQDNDAMTFSLKKDGVEFSSGPITDDYIVTTSFLSIGDHNISATVSDGQGLTSTVTAGVEVGDSNISPLNINPIMGDFNGDALVDIGVHNAANGAWQIALSSSGIFYNGVTWLTNFGTYSYEWPMPADYNSDGKSDAAIYNVNTGAFLVALSRGSAFSAPSLWFTFAGASSSWQPFGGNFNADKFADLGFYNKDTGEIKVALGTGAGFGSPVTWLTGFGLGYTVLTGDFNGDSLTDTCLFKKATGEFKVAFSNSKAFVDGTTWLSGYSVGIDPILTDFNNDGLIDVGYWDKASKNWYYAISTGTQFISKGVLVNYGNTSDESVAAADFNGDGVTDFSAFDSDKLGITRWSTQLSLNKPADLMSEIDNGVGGKTQITYTHASKSDNPLVPFPIYVASSISVVDTLPVDQPQEAYAQEYKFSGGYFDFTEREFRGFEKVTATDPITNNYAETHFYQGKSGQDGALKGQIDKIVAYDGNNLKISETLNTYEVRKAGPADNVLGFPMLKETTTTVWEENATSISTRNTFVYDNIGNVIEAKNDGDISKMGDEKSTTTIYAQAYSDGFNRPLEAVLKDKDRAAVTKKNFEYDLKGNLKKESVNIYNPLTMDYRLSTIDYSYDLFGNLISTTNALGQSVTTEYETSFYTFPQKVTNFLGHFISYIYDPKFGVVTSVTDANGQTSTSTYDSFGRIVEAKNADGIAVTTYLYPDFNTKTVTDALGLSKTYYVDGLGRKYKSVSSGEDGAAARQVSSEVIYNARGLVEKESIAHYIDEDLSQIPYVRYEYDLRGRPKKTFSDFPGTLKDAESSVSYVNPLYAETVDPQGHKKGALKDVYGNTIEITEFTQGGVYKTGYEYDIQNNLTKVTDSQGNITQIWYDSAGRKLRMDDPDMGVWTYEYDVLGNLIKQTDAKNQILEFQYDALNRLTGKQANGQTLVTYIYDDATKDNCVGRLSKIIDQSGSTEFFYDKFGREIKSTKTVGITPYTVERAYDVMDRLLTLKYPDDASVSYSYDPNSGLLEKVFSVDGGLSTVDYVKDITYSAQGQIKAIQYGNGTNTNYTYGQDLRLARIHTNNGQSTNLHDLNYIFDKNANITTLTDNLRSDIRTYSYDDLDRLTQAQNVPSPQGGNTNFNYQYDSIGNMTYKSDVGVMSYGVNAGPHAVTTAGGYNYSYDANGNMVTGKDKILEYDAENRLKSVVCGSTTVDYIYDGDGGLVKQSSVNASQASSTTYIGSLYEVDTSGIIKKYIYAGSQKVCSVNWLTGEPDNRQTYYYHGDHLGSSSIITDENGSQVSHYEYTPYGSIARTEGSDNTRYKFTGKQLFEDIGLYHYGARFYDPEIGRFITSDTIVQAPYDPQSLNRYAYCRNNPLNYIDPSGHSWFKKFFGKILGFVAGVVGTILSGGNMMVGFQLFNLFDSIGSTVNTGNWGGFAGGIAGGLIGGYLGGGLAGNIASSLGENAFTFGGGFLVGAAEMGLGGFGGSFGSILGSGGSFSDAMQSGAVGLGIGAAVGGLVEGSYLSGMQKFAHGMDRNLVGKAAGVDRRTVLEVTRTELPLVAEAVASGESGQHWGLKIQDNYNEWNGAWDFDIESRNSVVRGTTIFGSKLTGRAGLSNVRNWTDASIVSVDLTYISKVYGNIQNNLGRHAYKLDSYNCQTWVNNRRYLLNDNVIK